MNAPPRPDPDAILASLRREEARAGRGRLKVFFGMCPGVGKTYAMLSAAQAQARHGRDVVVGMVETHGRKETEALLAGLTVIPRRRVEHRGVALTEMDLEAILARRPKLVLVDELAHSNAPGSRHPKRYQDVAELLDAGIDVATTLNVQHLESRADAVRAITGAPVAETVPDSALERADEIELIDLTPEALRERLREGKVYPSERAAAAEQSFFKEANITALRELSLRFTAERMDKRLRDLQAAAAPESVWRSGERLLVAVGPSPSSTRLVRWTRRMAAAQGAAWIAVSVEASRPPAPEAQRRLDQNLALARELGAEVLVTHDDNLAAALIRVALQNKATQIVVGKSRNFRWLDLLRGGSLADRLLHRPEPLDIHVVPSERAEQAGVWIDWTPVTASPAREYFEVLAAIAAVSLAGWWTLPWAGYRAIGLLYLMAVIALSLRVGRWPVLAAGILGALLWDYCFIPPRFTFVISSFEDGLLFGMNFAVALIAGQLTARVHAQERNERAREQRATALFHLTRALNAAGSLDEAVFAALRQSDELFSAQTAILLAGESGGLVPHYAGSFTLDERDRGVADWVWHNAKKAGRFTDTLPSAESFALPLTREGSALGVLLVRMPPQASLTLGQRDLIEAFAGQIALLVEQENLRAAGEREKLLAESEKLHRVLLDSVSHELRTPLAVIASVLENIDQADPALRRSLAGEGRTAIGRLNRLVRNLLDQTRLESGALRAHPVWCGASDLAQAAREGVAEALAGHPVEMIVPDELAVYADFALTEQAIANLLLNAAVHTPGATPIFLTAGVEGGGRRIFFAVADRGPGIAPALRERLFKKFARGDAARAGGLGLGLSIVRGFVAAQGGEVQVAENPGGGAVITLYLPRREPEEAPCE